MLTLGLLGIVAIRKIHKKFIKLSGQKYLKSDHPVESNKLSDCPIIGDKIRTYFLKLYDKNAKTNAENPSKVNSPLRHSIEETHCVLAV